MNETLQKFLNESPIAEKVKLKGRVIINRSKLSAGDLARIGNQGNFTIPEKEEICELEVGGQALAKGKIVKKKGQYYFKVTDPTINKKGGQK